MSFSFAGWESVYDSRKHLTKQQEPEQGRQYTMYHGTQKSSAVNIVKLGFRPSTDGLLGAGVYVSRNVRKALCYPLNTSDNDKVVFKLKVKVGKVKKIDCDSHPLQKLWHQNGYDTAWVPRNSNISSIKSGREEDCVWDPKNIKIIDISHCQDAQLKENLLSLIKTKNGRPRGGSARAAACRVCSKGMEDLHERLPCWECGQTICPFLSKHVCRLDHEDCQ